MDLVGARFRPLPNSPRYGPKRWKQDSEGVWVEQEITALDRFESDLAWADNPTMERSTPITEEDAARDSALRDYVDGFAVFPKVENINTSTEEGKARARKQESDWEKRSLAMHAAQQPLPPPAEKPQETWGGVKVERGD